MSLTMIRAQDALNVFVRAGFSHPARPRGTGSSAPLTLGSVSQVAVVVQLRQQRARGAIIRGSSDPAGKEAHFGGVHIGATIPTAALSSGVDRM
jgi:hypothetical protein